MAKPAQPSGKTPQRSFSQMADAQLKLGYLYYTVDLVSGQELYMNYDESSTEEDPVILAEGIDIHGNAFRQKIHLNEIDVKNASLAEMTALNLHLGKQGDQAIKSHYSFPLETLSSQRNLTDKMDFEQYFQQNNKKLQSAGCRKEVELYKSELERYLFFQKGGKFRKNKAREHVLFEKEETNKTGIFSNKTLAEAAGVKLDPEMDWESDGTDVLSEEQIRYLQEKYDVEDLSEKDYRGLLEELTKMNVISGEDAKKQFELRMAPCIAMVMPAYGNTLAPEGDDSRNYLLKLQKETDYAEFVLDMIRQGKCSVSPESSLDSVRRFYEKEQEYHKKIEEIFRQLQRTPSRTEDTSGDQGGT